MKSKPKGSGAHPDKAQDAKMVRHGVHKHESNMHPGKKKTPIKFGKK